MSTSLCADLRQLHEPSNVTAVAFCQTQSDTILKANILLILRAILLAKGMAKKSIKLWFAARGALAFLLIAASLVACDVQTYDEAASSFNNNTTVPPPPPPPPPPAAFNATFTDIQDNVFTPTCATANCHAGANPDENLNLDAQNSYAMLVGIASNQVPGTLRVAPGNPDASYLIQKMEGTAAVAGVMPPGGSIAQSSIDVVRAWITAGAVDNRPPAAAPIRIETMFPAPNAPLDAAPVQIIAGFDRVVDASTVNATTFLLEGSGGDGTFGEANDVVINAPVSAPGANPEAAVMDLSAANLVDDTYRVRLLGSGASFIMDLDSNALDGEYFGVFPTGNGTEGGDYQSNFVVSAPVVVPPTLAEIQASVFTPSCSSAGCHSGGGVDLPTILDLTNAAGSFASLVGQPSIQMPGTDRVVPGDPINSYLMHKLEGTQGAGQGQQMPIGAPLPAALIEDVRQWILAGAQP
jgi:hypothetical protein